MWHLDLKYTIYFMGYIFYNIYIHRLINELYIARANSSVLIYFVKIKMLPKHNIKNKYLHCNTLSFKNIFAQSIWPILSCIIKTLIVIMFTNIQVIYLLKSQKHFCTSNITIFSIFKTRSRLL